MKKFIINNLIEFASCLLFSLALLIVVIDYFLFKGISSIFAMILYPIFAVLVWYREEHISIKAIPFLICAAVSTGSVISDFFWGNSHLFIFMLSKIKCILLNIATIIVTNSINIKDTYKSLEKWRKLRLITLLLSIEEISVLMVYAWVLKETDLIIVHHIYLGIVSNVIFYFGALITAYPDG